ncbi:NADH-ubiquinone oxidoreductase subunit [Melia azedarach]|uniref:NADH-ubiquinone oxidoreductase subunit n=1 Tax=Melia azedarach TaxID=155640 RepID=A0ACC1WZJ7_MELAZ|nr:NADH-ubiquinone oxidoreductase subunit [Melia azedarach]
MNTDITASEKPQYPVIDRNPPFTTVVGIKPGLKGPSMVTGGLIGLMGGFMYAYQNSAGRIMGFFPNEGEVSRYQKRGYTN